MTFDQFIDKWLGKKADWDGAYAGQCVDLFRYYCDEVLNIEQPSGVRGAANFWTDFDTDPILTTYFKKIVNTSTGVPQKGDVILWDFDAGGGYGHVAIFIEGDANQFTSLDQNWPTLSKVTKTKHNYTNVYGWLRFKGGIMAGCLLPDTEENRKTWEKLVGNSSKYDAFKSAGFSTADEVKNKIAELEGNIAGKEETLKSLNQTISSKNDQMSILQSQISTKEQLLLEANTRLDSLTEQAKKVPELTAQLEHLTEAKEVWVEAEKTFNRRISQLQTENEELRSGVISTLIRVLFEEIIKKIKKTERK